MASIQGRIAELEFEEDAWLNGKQWHSEEEVECETKEMIGIVDLLLEMFPFGWRIYSPANTSFHFYYYHEA